MSPRLVPLPTDPADAPKYWRDETSGVLARAIRVFLGDPGDLTVRDVAYIRAYLSQWIQSPAWDANPHHDDRSRAALAELRAGVGAIADAADIRAWLFAALGEGHDPL